MTSRRAADIGNGNSTNSRLPGGHFFAPPATGRVGWTGVSLDIYPSTAGGALFEEAG